MVAGVNFFQVSGDRGFLLLFIPKLLNMYGSGHIRDVLKSLQEWNLTSSFFSNDGMYFFSISPDDTPTKRCQRMIERFDFALSSFGLEFCTCHTILVLSGNKLKCRRDHESCSIPIMVQSVHEQSTVPGSNSQLA